MSSKVYIPQVPMKFDASAGQLVPKFDTLDAAREYGQLVVLIDSPMALAARQECINRIVDGLREYKEGDFFLPMGSHFFMMIAAVCISNRVSRIQILDWNQREQQYRRAELKVDQLKMYDPRSGR